MSEFQQNRAESNAAPGTDLLQFLKRSIPAHFGTGDTGLFSCRFLRGSHPEAELNQVVDRFRKEGWEVAVRTEGNAILLDFANPPPGTIQLSNSDGRLVQTLLSRIRRFVSAGLLQGQGTYKLLEPMPYRVVHCTAEILRSEGWQVTLISGGGGHLRSIVIGLPVSKQALSEANLPAQMK